MKKSTIPRTLIIVGFAVAFCGAMILRLMDDMWNLVFLRLNALLGLIPVTIGIILMIINDKKSNKKISWIKIAALAYCTVIILAITISFLI